MLTTSCKIESKTFQISNNQNRIQVKETGHQYLSSAVFSLDLLIWIRGEIGKVRSDRSLNDFIATKRDGDVVVSINIRANTHGRYLSILFIAKNIRKGNTALCIPEAVKVDGWGIFLKHISMVIPKVHSQNNGCSLEPIGGIPQLFMRSGFEDEVEILREKGIVLDLSNRDYHWKHIAGDLQSMFDLSRPPKVTPVGGNTYLLVMGCSDDVSKAMENPDLTIDGCMVKMRMWRPASATLLHDWAERNTRMVDLIGVPVHLRDDKVIGELCSGFGKLIKTTQYTGKATGVTPQDP